MSKKRILFIMHMPPPVHGAAMMGKYIHDSKLINETFDCSYINPSASKNVAEIGKMRLTKIKFLLRNILYIRKIIHEKSPDLVYITPSAWDWGFYRDCLTVLMLKSMKCRIIAHYHNKGNRSFESRWHNKMLYRYFFKNIYTIFLSERLVPEFRDYLKPEQIYICPNGIESQNICPHSRMTVHNPYNFLFLSNMMKEKGVYVLLEACKLLKSKGYSFSCKFVGKWADVQPADFQRVVSEFGINDCISAYGPQYGTDKQKFFQESDSLIFPTYYHGETFGLVLLEGMDYGMPVIGTSEGGIPDIIDDEVTGFVVKPKDSQMLADKMAWFIDHPSDGREMGKRGKLKFDSDFTLQQFENRFCKILIDCLSK